MIKSWLREIFTLSRALLMMVQLDPNELFLGICVFFSFAFQLLLNKRTLKGLAGTIDSEFNFEPSLIFHWPEKKLLWSLLCVSRDSNQILLTKVDFMPTESVKISCPLKLREVHD